MNIILLTLRCMVFAGTALGVFAAFKYISTGKIVKNSLITMYEKINSSGENRRKSEQMIRQMYGSYNRKGLLSHIDENLRYSGIQIKYHYITTELYLAGAVMLLTAVFVLVSLVCGNMLYGAGAAAVLVLAVELHFNSRRRSRYNSVGDELLPLINSIDAYAGTTDDIISILEKTIPVLTGPLKEAVYSAVSASKKTGSSSEALRLLEDSMEHPFFKKLIRNLEISSRHSCNYKDIITECRYQLDEATGNEKKLEKIYKDGRFEIIIIIICGMTCVLMALVGVLDFEVKGFFTDMWETIPGKFILVLCAVVLMISFYIAFITSQRRGRNE